MEAFAMQSVFPSRQILIDFFGQLFIRALLDDGQRSMVSEHEAFVHKVRNILKAP
jgi:hypothetical protein